MGSRGVGTVSVTGTGCRRAQEQGHTIPQTVQNPWSHSWAAGVPVAELRLIDVYMTSPGGLFRGG